MTSSAVGVANAGSIEYPIVKQVIRLANRKAWPRQDADVKRDRKKGMNTHGWILER
jgi:hypothetical protein